MASFYNEIDPYAAAWLRNLIKAGLIPDGEVSTQSIVDLRPADLSGFDQCHFFAGIGGWSQALHLAGWAPDRPVWTGSCPCQPFSVAGKGAGIDDARHLWPHFHRLIAACRPPVVLGEQVAGKAGYGWFDGVRADLEGTGYAGRAVDIPALAVGAPHIRQRLYWVALDMANADDARFQGTEWRRSAGAEGKPAGHPTERDSGDMADAQSIGREERERQDRQQDAGSGSQGRVDAAGTDKGHMADADEGGRGRRPRDGDGECDGQAGGRVEDHSVAAGGGEDRLDVAHPDNNGAGCDVGAAGNGGRTTVGAGAESLRQAHGPFGASRSDARSTSGGGFWSNAIWAGGSDGKVRRIEPCIPLLAHGVPGRVGKLRAYGNAIVAPLAAEVVKALMETLDV
jgi:DNA (cytosine-5)-methyltransferase 1